MGRRLTSKKAKQILRDNSAQGHALTSKQKRFFGAIAGGAKPYASTRKRKRTQNQGTDNGKDY